MSTWCMENPVCSGTSTDSVTVRNTCTSFSHVISAPIQIMQIQPHVNIHVENLWARLTRTCFMLNLVFIINYSNKSSDIKELHVRTVKHGGDVTIECNISSVTEKDKLVWYRQR
ncbi:hypothetical protein QTP86_002147 [Hemibagrus guttatus]|nr:hypothetical protein QTP86_002147 [Hemibagrus guttatus]